MLTVFLSLVVILLSILGLSLAVLVGRQPIRTCGRGSKESDASRDTCAICGEHRRR